MSTKTNPKALIPYLRQSRAREQTISFEEQWRKINAWAAYEDVPILEGVEERGVSGSKHWRERELGEVIERVKRGEARGIIVAYQSRLSRESGLATAEVWEELERIGARLVCVEENIDTARADKDNEEFNFGLQALLARREWKRSKRGFASARRSAIERGICTARACFGFAKDETRRLIFDGDDKVKIAKAMFEGRADTKSYGALRKLSFEMGHELGESTIRGMIKNEQYIGVLRDRIKDPDGNVIGEVVNEHAHKPMITRDLFDRANAATGVREVGTPSNGTRGMLKSLIRCASCHGAMTVSRSGSKGRFNYYCRAANLGGCSAQACIDVDLLDSYVDEVMLDFLKARASEALVLDEQNGSTARLDEADEMLAQAEDEYTHLKRRLPKLTTLDDDEIDEMLADAKAKVDIARANRANASNECERLRYHMPHFEVWQDSDEEDKREMLIGHFVSEVRVKKGRRNVNDRVTLIDREGTLIDPSEVRATVEAMEARIAGSKASTWPAKRTSLPDTLKREARKKAAP